MEPTTYVRNEGFLHGYVVMIFALCPFLSVNGKEGFSRPELLCFSCEKPRFSGHGEAAE